MAFQVVEWPGEHPGICQFCGGQGGTRDYFIDTGHVEDYIGKVYICSSCVGEIAKVAGLIPKQELEDQLEDAERLNKLALGKAKKYVNVIDSLDRRGLDLFDFLNWLHSRSGAKGNIDREDFLDARKTVTPKSDSVPGPDDAANAKRSNKSGKPGLVLGSIGFGGTEEKPTVA